MVTVGLGGAPLALANKAQKPAKPGVSVGVAVGHTLSRVRVCL
eukprot:COSAG02_NODE_4530_length_5252_cov_5.919658_9_plen_43_part_00